MKLGLAIKEQVEVKASGIRLGHRGRVVNRFARSRPIYAIQFSDNCIGYFDGWELKKVLLEKSIKGTDKEEKNDLRARRNAVAHQTSTA